jgi:hypothetical protein
MNQFSRRGLLKGALGIGAAAAGARMVGPWVGEAEAATETSHFVHIFFHGGLNALFAGCAQQLRGSFGVTDNNMVAVGNGVHTDRDTFGTFPQLALDHWAAIGLRHGDANHTVPENRRGGGEMAIVRNGTNCYLNQLAAAMGGDSAFKAVLFGRRSQDYGVFQPWPAVSGVSLQRIANLRDALAAVGAETPNPDAPDRVHLASTLEASEVISARHMATNPGRLASLSESYDAAVTSLRKPPPPPVTFEEVNEAYGLGGRSAIVPGGATSFAAQFAGAEIMIRAAGSNVIHLTDFEPMWDFDANVNGPRSRARFLGTGTYSRLAPIRTFLQRMLNFPGKNVVVAISGEFVRELNGHGHGAGIVAAVFGKNVKQGLSFPINGQARFSTNTPGSMGFWAGIAAACKVPGQPFGANPHALLA